MKITVAKSDLEAALAVASIGISSAGSDLSAHYLFRIGENNTCEVLTYQTSITVSVPLVCGVEGDPQEAMTVEGWRLTKWLSGVGDVSVTLENTDRGEVTVSSNRSKVRLKALDPKKFPFWDKTLGEAVSIIKLKADRLANALAYSKNFVWVADTTRPELSQVEVLDGVLWATDKRAVTIVTLEGFEKSNLRIHGKDIPSVLKFLSRSDDVELLEHDRSVFLRREDGATLGASRPISKFPSIGVDPNEGDQMSWEISAEDLLAGIHCLSASADKDNTKVQFVWEDDQVQLKVQAVVGGEDAYPMAPVSQEGLSEFPSKGFQIDHPYLTHIMGAQGGDTLKFGLNLRKMGGYSAFRHTRDNDKYLTVVIWR